jgi:L-ascorbate metabolism protein UlaG (beta-lactamase superfamily)
MSPVAFRRTAAAVLALVFALAGVVFAAGLLGLAAPAGAQTPESRACALGLVQKTPNFSSHPYFRPASAQPVPVPKRHVRVTFVGHSTMLIESPEGVSVATDYNGYVKPNFLPDIVTMNNSHETHYTDLPDAGIKFVLRGWDPQGGIARHDIRVKDMRIHNVPTNFAEWDGRKSNQNSIFVIEAGQVCLAHVGHLHHVLTDNQTLGVGRIDVLFIPIDGTYTMSLEEAARVVAKVRPKLVIPMHFFGVAEGSVFAQSLKGAYPIKFLKTTTILLARKDLPKTTEVWFLREMMYGGLGGE